MQRNLFNSAEGCWRLQSAPLAAVIKIALAIALISLHFNYSLAQQASLSFPGVARELASFCSARPSLSIDLAPMIVHVKKNTSFNYKLYLFSQDEHVFQTGQIVPRDDFRIHSFPVKLKHLNEFVPVGQSKPTDDQQPVEVYRLEPIENERAQDHQSRRRSRLVRVPSFSFDTKRFFSRVPLVLEPVHRVDNSQTRRQHRSRTANEDDAKLMTTTSKPQSRSLPFDVQGDELPGDHQHRHDAILTPEFSAINSKILNSNANEHIEFDRDDQLAILGQPSNRLRELNRRHSQRSGFTATTGLDGDRHHHQTMVVPVGSFSSFRVNITYMARKDFDQVEPEVVRLRVDARRFQVSRVDILTPLDRSEAAIAADDLTKGNFTGATEDDDLPEPDDYAFLSHKLLRDRSVRLTAITQIYEDWITRNYYTIVYIQRRLNEPVADDEHADILLAADEVVDRGRVPSRGRPARVEPVEVITERLVFRGSSTVLLGADQLNYAVKASAFITEKNGLHYYLEFLANGKFHLGAIDWTKRPFKFIDSQRFPIKPTRTQFDNEELLLCPPSVCYSEQPVDELVAYGRLSLSDKLQREASILSKSSSGSGPATSIGPTTSSGDRVLTLMQQPESNLSNNQTTATISHQSESISLDNLIEAMRAGSSELDVRLHLRDWTWQVAAQRQKPDTRFVWHYEWARRNELKVTRDTYGFALAGNEIDASYRVFNELYLISANHLISINYTLANETVTSVHPIGEEFPGLSSSLLDPITGAFYDRYSNQIYFFKGDRYVGYDYATKRPLEDFLLPPAIDDTLGSLNLALLMQPTATASSRPDTRQQQQQQLVSSLPVVGILGQQHQVDAIYHDLGEDLVYVFSAMKFYTHKASDFKDGAFKAAAGEQPFELEWRCTNERFLAGCRFDAAYPNPCHSDNLSPSSMARPVVKSDSQADDDVKEQDSIKDRKKQADKLREPASEERESSFSDEQQKKLRSIAARGGLMDFLLENTLVAQGAARAFGQQSEGQTRNSNSRPAPRAGEPEQIIVYLLIAMVLVTVLITVAMIIIVLNWARIKVPNNQLTMQKAKTMPSDDEQRFNQPQLGNVHGQILSERVAYPPAITHYLNNQYQQRLNSGAYYYPTASIPAASQRSSGFGTGPLTSPPNMPPPPAPRRSEYSQTGVNFGRIEREDNSMF